MTSYLLDTNVISEPLKRTPSRSVLAHIAAQKDANMFTSAVCLMELRRGAARHPHPERLWRQTESMLERLIVLPFATPEANVAGEISAALWRVGRPIGEQDVMIAATAVVHGLDIATRNVGHFRRIPGLRVVDWFADEA
jgi:predicted nucleic acid-binding protein